MTWPGRIAVAITRGDPPEVFLAEDERVLSRLIALRLVASTSSQSIERTHLDEIRSALLDARWGDAVACWIGATGIVVDAYPDEFVWTDDQLDSETASFEIRMAPIFE